MKVSVRHRYDCGCSSYSGNVSCSFPLTPCTFSILLTAVSVLLVLSPPQSSCPHEHAGYVVIIPVGPQSRPCRPGVVQVTARCRLQQYVVMAGVVTLLWYGWSKGRYHCGIYIVYDAILVMSRRFVVFSHRLLGLRRYGSSWLLWVESLVAATVALCRQELDLWF